MVDAHRYHWISESTHRIMNPLSLERLMLVGQICRLGEGTRILDLASGKGEMLCQFAAAFGVSGIGVDIYPPLVEAARQRAAELEVADKIEFVEGDAGKDADYGSFDVVTCIGATWIGGGLSGTLELMKRHLVRGGWLVVGECFWAKEPSAELTERYGQEFSDLAGTADIFQRQEVDLVEMVITNEDDWDRYAASQWLNVSDWLLANPGHPDAAAMQAERDESRHEYLSEGRGTLGWGVFIGRPLSR